MPDYTLAIGDKTYSSWSLRGWLMFSKFDIPVTVRSAFMKTPDFTEMLADFGNAQTVPALRAGDIIVTDSLAIAETLAETYANLWPSDPVARGLARSIVAEMHAGFMALRGDCPMNLRRCYANFAPSEAVLADVSRIEELWAKARADHGNDGPWLFGAYSLADVFFAPVAMRIATYGLPVGDLAARYVETHLQDTKLRQWRAMGLAQNYIQKHYDMDLTEIPWPGPAPRDARAVHSGTAINTLCPFSQKLVTEDGRAEIDGRIVGFCDSFCRDKFVADPEAWPKAIALLTSD